VKIVILENMQTLLKRSVSLVKVASIRLLRIVSIVRLVSMRLQPNQKRAVLNVKQVSKRTSLQSRLLAQHVTVAIIVLL